VLSGYIDSGSAIGKPAQEKLLRQKNSFAFENPVPLLFFLVLAAPGWQDFHIVKGIAAIANGLCLYSPRSVPCPFYRPPALGAGSLGSRSPVLAKRRMRCSWMNRPEPTPE